MKDLLRKLIAGLGVATLLAACGGGGDSDDGGGNNAGGGNTANRPVAALKASVDDVVLAGGASVTAGSKIVLDASASTTPSGTLSYAWRLIQQPGTVQIDAPQAAKTAFVPEIAGDYIVGLSVDNGEAIASEQLAFQVLSEYPVAVVSRLEQDMPLGQVQLDGRGSLPPSGGDASELQYAWKLVSVPPDSTVTSLAEEERTQAQPRFTADVPGDYTLELSVSYRGKVSLTPATLKIRILPAATLPLAVITQVSALPNVRDQKITLSAQDSTPGNRGSAATMQYRWYLSNGSIPAPLAALDGATTSQASFTPVAVGTYTVTLMVFDGVQYSTASYPIVITRPEGAANVKPVAVIKHLYNLNTFEVEMGARTDLYGRESYDFDEQWNTNLTYEWTLLEEPAQGAAKLEFNGRYSYFTPRENDSVSSEKYKFQLRVKDSEGAWSEPVTAVYTALRGANRTPVAAIGIVTGSETVKVGTEVLLTGAGSSDRDNNQLSYRWTLKERPDGSAAELKNADKVQASFTADKAGAYLAALVVTDSKGSSSIGSVEFQVKAKSQNYAPEVRAYQARVYDRDQPLLIAPERTVAGLYTFEGPLDLWGAFEINPNAYDPDGDALSFLWNLTKLPANYTQHNWGNGTASCMAGAPFNPFVEQAQVWLDRQLNAREWVDCQSLVFSPSKTGIYDLTLYVSDGSETVGPLAFSLQAATRADYPTLLLEDLHKGHEWSNSAAALEIQNKARNDGLAPTQIVFPAKPGTNVLGSSLGLDVFRGDYVLDTFRLTAAGGDYTITDLKAVDAKGREVLKFTGLQNDQVLRKGQVQEFQLVWNIANMPGICADGDGYYLSSQDFTWSFSIKEKPGFTFSYKPTGFLAGC